MKHILLAVSGVSPAQIIEILADVWTKHPSDYPCLLEIIATKKNKIDIKSKFVGKRSDLALLCHKHELPAISCDVKNILIPFDDDKQYIKDLNSEREQEIITDYIADRVHLLSEDPELTIHAVITGRKILAYVLGYAMHQFGRSQGNIIPMAFNENKTSDSPTCISNTKNDIKVDKLYDENLHVKEIVSMKEKESFVILDYEDMSFEYNGKKIYLQPDTFAFYSWLAQDSRANPEIGICSPARVNLTEKMLHKRMKNFILAATKIIDESELTQFEDMGSLQNLGGLFMHTNKVIENVIENDKKLHNTNPSHIIRKNYLLSSRDNTDYLLDPQCRKNDGVCNLRTKMKNLWVRLLKQAKSELSNLCVEGYESIGIVTVDTSGGRTPYDFKGIKCKVVFKNSGG